MSGSLTRSILTAAALIALVAVATFAAVSLLGGSSVGGGAVSGGADGGAEVFNVYFDGNGGDPAETKVQAERGSRLSEPVQPVRVGYLFGGWYRESVCITPWNFATDAVGGDTVLYAKWSFAPLSGAEA
ncbi:MAG: InlB B-repeat-containing protein [Candidatus Methanoplasma sp.]|jgi:uncharacterized repeat protein (TIGR02543 family)|nr:InlB B-repeat-containing protein [Candidatus Methanoplasma sp.]